MYKKTVSILLIISLFISTVAFTSDALSGDITVKINGERVLFDDVGPFVDSNSTIMCPLSIISEKLGYDVTWNGMDKSIILEKNSNTIKLKIDDSNVFLNEKNITLNTKPIIKQNRTFVPIQFLSDSMELIMGWDNKTKVLNINEPKANSEDYFKQSNINNTISQNLNEYMNALVERKNFHGSVLVAKDGNVILNKGYSMADFEQSLANTSQTKHPIGSVTKQFTAMAIMQLCEKGLISIDDTIDKYLTDFPNAEKITIHNLLTHSSGLGDYLAINELYSLKDVQIENIINLLKDTPLEFEPGERYRYSNSGYLLLGYIVEKVSNMSYGQYLKENIFVPLNMENTGICFDGNTKMYDSSGYVGHLDVIPVDDQLILDKSYGAGCLYSTTEDLYRWDQALYTESLVNKDTLDKIFKGYVEIAEAYYSGYGWLIRSSQYGKVTSHDGMTFGTSANIARFTDKNLTIIILTNVRDYNVYNLTDILADIVFEKEYKMPEAYKEVQINSDVLEKYVGQYQIAPQVFVNITIENSSIFARVTGQEALEIFPESKTEYFYKLVDAQITFEKDSDDEVTGLIIHQSGVDTPAQKVN